MNLRGGLKPPDRGYSYVVLTSPKLFEPALLYRPQRQIGIHKAVGYQAGGNDRVEQPPNNGSLCMAYSHKPISRHQLIQDPSIVQPIVLHCTRVLSVCYH